MELTTLYKDALIIVALLVITTVLIYKFWEKVNFWWLNTSYSFPFFGKLKSLAKNHQEKDGVFLSEEQLCNDYIIHYNRFQKDGAVYERSEDYLDLLGEKKRKPMTLVVWAFIVGLIIIEALGFAYVLSGYAVPGASENVKQYGAYGIGALISVILVYLTHQTGHILYDNSMIKKIRIWWRQDKSNPNRPQLNPRPGIGLENHDDDRADPIYIRFLSRIPANATVTPSIVVPIITAIFIIFVAIGSTYVRGEVMAVEMTEEKAALNTSSEEVSVWGDAPSELVADQSAADKQVAEESQQHFEKGAWAAFIVLAVIFVFLQIFGILIGYNRGFAGEDSEKAYNTIHKFTSREEFIHFYDHRKKIIAKIAQSKLQTLQQTMRELLDSGNSDAPTNHRPQLTFYDFVHDYEQKHHQAAHDKTTAFNDAEERVQQTEADRKRAKRKRENEEMLREIEELEEQKALADKLKILKSEQSETV